MLGSVAEAEDIVAGGASCGWHGLPRARRTRPQPDAFVTTVDDAPGASTSCARPACRRESYVGEWLPEPLVDARGSCAAWRTSETISLAFLVLLERLSPEERAVLVLREAFDYGYEEIGAILGKRRGRVPPAAEPRAPTHRRTAARASTPDAAARDALAARFLAAARDGDLAGLVALLAPDAVLVGDGGGKALAISRPLARRDRDREGAA